MLRDIFYVKKSNLDLSAIKNQNLIIDLHGLDMKVAYKKELRLLYNLLSVAYIREALRSEPSAVVKNMFIADEAQLLVPKKLHKAIATDTWVTTDFATRLRKRGESLVIISQSPANIEDDIRKNAQNLFLFRLLDPLDVKVVSGMLGYVHVDEINYLSNMLTCMESRRAIAKSPVAPNPFIVRTLDVDLPKLKENELKPYLAKTQREAEEELNEDEKELMQNIKEKPFLNNTERALWLRWHKTRYSLARKTLISKGVAEEITFKTNLKGAPSRFLKVKDKAAYGKGGFMHAYWVDRIFEYLKSKDTATKRIPNRGKILI